MNSTVKVFGILTLASAMLLTSGCMDRTQLVDQNDDNELVAGIGYKDFEMAATEAVQAIFSSRKVAALTANSSKTYVVAISRVTDETPLQIDTDLLTTRISEALVNDDRFEVSSVFADKADNRDEMVSAARQVRGNSEFDSSTIQKAGQLKAPDFSLSGKIIARDVRRDNGGHQYEYYFQLSLANLTTGTKVMVKETKVIKRTGKKSHRW
ncbi:MAG: penicillin-binding protein activator LpoB [Kiritimatiellia bacterium]